MFPWMKNTTCSTNSQRKLLYNWSTSWPLSLFLEYFSHYPTFFIVANVVFGWLAYRRRSSFCPVDVTELAQEKLSKNRTILCLNPSQVNGKKRRKSTKNSSGIDATGSGEDRPNNYVNNTFSVQNDIAHQHQRSQQDMTNFSSYDVERRQMLALTERQRIHSMAKDQRQSYLARR
ncbi:uncharacterized protein [Henckelia pumila]|uniref:uncharacterized protein isoform X2 n=1 Tax=Henckelia pumila TaxID=405737 RepID=UPI003C6E4D88